jgi:phosphoribosylamine--glycine ligase
MAANHISTATARSFEQMDQALAYLDQQSVPIVVKADGLAQGKGVVVAMTREEAKQAVRDAMEKSLFGQAGHRVLIEEFLDGEELTIMAFTDGKTVVPMLPAQDHKRVGDGDTGANTGGMGAYAPAPIATTTLREQVTRDVLQPTVDALARLGCPFQGVLYAGLMIVKGTPYVLEFNARMGDPETEVVLPLLKTDLIDVMEVVVEQRLDQLAVEWRSDNAVCVVMTSPGYPGSYRTGFPIQGLTTHSPDAHIAVFHAGTRREAERVVTAGGRVLAVTAWGPSLHQAREQVYQTLPSIQIDGRHYRTDIAHRALPRNT